MPLLPVAQQTAKQTEALPQVADQESQQAGLLLQAAPRHWSMADDRAILTKLFLGFGGQAPPEVVVQVVSVELSSSGGAACSAADVHARLAFLAAEFQKHKPDAP